MIRAVIFDFDGLILDTETPEYDAWRSMYQDHGADLPLEQYLRVIGSSYAEAGFIPFEFLSQETGLSLDQQTVEADVHQRKMALLAAQRPLPGVLDRIAEAQQRGLRLAVASSSSRDWVEGHLQRLGLRAHFVAVRTRDDVGGVVKPAPDVYLAALSALEVGGAEAIVFEDSASGVQAANTAGCFTVAVPNNLTRHLRLDHADVVVSSLANTSLDILIPQAENGRR